MSLKLGSWKFNQNGMETILVISNVDANGTVSGTLNSAPIVGLWDDVSRQITFSLMMPGNTFFIYHRIYKGVLFSTPTSPQLGQDVQWTLVGFIDVTDQATLQMYQGSARRRQFGWFAQITEIS